MITVLMALICAGPRAPEQWLRGAAWVQVGVLLLPYVIACGMVFPSMDDWSYGASGRAGWWHAQCAWYMGWSGRPAATALVSGWGSLGTPWFASVIGYRLVIVAIFAAVASAWWWFLGGWRPTGDPAFRKATWLAGLTLWVIALPDPTEALYWLAGAATYSCGLAMALAWAAAMRGAWTTERRSAWYLALVLGLLVPLFNEIQAVVMACSAGILVVAAGERKRLRMLVVASAIWLAVAISLLAPGNAVRSQVANVPGSADPLHLLVTSAGIGWELLRELPWVPMLVVTLWWLGAAGITHRQHQPAAWRGWLPGVFIVALGWVALVPLAYAGMAPARAFTALVALTVAALLLLVWQVSRWRRVTALIALVIACAAVIHGLGGGWNVVPIISSLLLVWWASRYGYLARVSRNGVMVACLAAAMVGSATWRRVCGDVFLRGPGLVLFEQERYRELARSSPGMAVIVAPAPGPAPLLLMHQDCTSPRRPGRTPPWRRSGDSCRSRQCGLVSPLPIGRSSRLDLLRRWDQRLLQHPPGVESTEAHCRSGHALATQVTRTGFRWPA